jgi:hypothetical protein
LPFRAQLLPFRAQQSFSWCQWKSIFFLLPWFIVFCAINLNPAQTESFHPEMAKYCQHKSKDSPDNQKKLQVAGTSRDDTILILGGLSFP